MDPITLNLRVGRTPAASLPSGGELSAEEIDANFTNLKAAAEQLDTEKVATADLVAVDTTVTPTAGDKVIVIRGGAFYQALVDSLLGSGSSAAPLKAWDDWTETRFPVSTSPQSTFAGAAISSGSSNNASPIITLQDGYWQNGILISSSATANSGYRWLGSHSAIQFGFKTMKSRTVLRLITGTSTIIRFGFHDTTTFAEPTDGVWFDVVGGVASGCARANGTKYTTTTNFTPTLNQVYICDLEVSADATLATFSILDGITEEVLWTDTVANGIPTTTARMTNMGLIATCSTTSATNIAIFYLFGFGTVAGFNHAMGIVPTPATAPAAFTAGDWTAAATATAGEISFDLVTLPSDGGSAITALEYRVDGGAAIAFTGTGTGVRVVTAGLTAGVASDLEVRAVNAVGAGAWSDVKNRTPAASGGGGAMAVLSSTMVENYFDVFNVTIPATTAGSSLICMCRQDKVEVTVDGGTADGYFLNADTAYVHFFHVNGVSAGTTTATFRFFTSGTPAASWAQCAVIEVDASGVVVNSTLADDSGSGTVVDNAFATTSDNALAVGIWGLSSTANGTSPGAWTGFGTAFEAIAGYLEDCGTAGSKTADVGISASRNWQGAVRAYLSV